MNEPIAIGEMSSQIMPVHCHLTMARALKGNDIPIFGSPCRSSWGVCHAFLGMRDKPLRTIAWEANFLDHMQGCQTLTSSNIEN